MAKEHSNLLKTAQPSNCSPITGWSAQN